MKSCSKCQETMSLDKFEKGRNCCRRCRTEYKNKLRSGTKWREKRFKYYYGISISDYDKMSENQGHVCLICSTRPKNYWGDNLAVDHDHKTGKIRGLLCDKCNKGLGQFKDDPELLLKAIKYLRG